MNAWMSRYSMNECVSSWKDELYSDSLEAIVPTETNESLST